MDENNNKDNKLIATFMAVSVLSPKTKHTYYDFGENWNQLGLFQQIIHSNMLRYDSDWNWLKPVIDKIIKTIGVKMVTECSKEEWYVSTNVTRMYIGVDILQAHHYVVEFIRWYNTQKV